MLIVIVSVLGACLAEDIGSCSFSRDCESYDYCQTIQDAGCVCNFGQCVITGNPFFRGSECEQYTDCACKNNPDACFCEDGFCRETRWECHKNGDCAKLSKCDGLSCTCSGNLSEFDCAVDDDCKDFHCNQALGYICKCENSLCAYKENPTECKHISDCVDQGTCLASQPCACTQEYCTLPWWVQDRDQHNNCRSDQVQPNKPHLPKNVIIFCCMIVRRPFLAVVEGNVPVLTWLLLMIGKAEGLVGCLLS